MALLEIRKYPDAVLTTVASSVKNITGETAKLVGDLLETMYAAPGVGLAAPQVGISERVIVLDVDHENPRKQVLKLINPVITLMDGEVIWEEGCLSVVDFTAEVKRAAQVEVIGFDENQKEIKIQAEGLLAVALQHEIDHLDGKLFIDRVSRLKRDLYRRRRKKMLRDGTAPATENPRVLI
jgi:peptide deformylase